MNYSALDTLRERIAEARAQLQPLCEQAVQDAGEMIVDELSSAAPRGNATDSVAPPGDSDGPLAESFIVQEEAPPSGTGAAITVRTMQPTKMRYVTQGTGIFGPSGQRIYPVQAQALYWQGAAHPVTSIAGQRPNDFVSPVLDSAPDAEEVLGWVVGEIQTILEGA